jgi:hypothetical protein
MLLFGPLCKVVNFLIFHSGIFVSLSLFPPFLPRLQLWRSQHALYPRVGVCVKQRQGYFLLVSTYSTPAKDGLSCVAHVFRQAHHLRDQLAARLTSTVWQCCEWYLELTKCRACPLGTRQHLPQCSLSFCHLIFSVFSAFFVLHNFVHI